MRQQRIAPLAVMVALALLAVRARADWPMQRHDPQRTGGADRVSDLAVPDVAWRFYLGGSVNELFAVDPRGDGHPRVIFAAGGRLVAKDWDDTTIWTAPLLGLDRIRAIRDLDGDGVLDIVATGYPSLLAVIRASDGAIEWRLRPGVIGATVGAVRIADFNRDGRPDMYVADAACGDVASLGDIGLAFSFAGGFTGGAGDASTALWQLERGREYVCGYSDIAADLTGDGRPEIVAFASTVAYVFDGATGRKIRSGDDAMQNGYALGFSLPYGALVANASDLDGDGREEIIGHTNNRYAAPINSRAIWVMEWDPSRSAVDRFRVRWRRSVTDTATEQHVFLDDSLGDVNGDGIRELVTTFVSAVGTPETVVLEARDGSQIGALAGEALVGLYASPGRGSLVATTAGTQLRFRSLTGWVPNTDLPGPSARVEGGRVVSVLDLSRRERVGADHFQLSAPLAADVLRVYVSSNAAIEAWDFGATTATRAASLPLNGMRIAGAATERGILRPDDGLLLSRSDGLVLVTDLALRVLNLGDSSVSLTGVRTGGYYASDCRAQNAPVAARFGADRDDLVAIDSRGSVLRLDAAGASLTTPPRARWEWANASSPLLVDLDGDRIEEVIASQFDPVAGTARQVTALDAAGAELWAVTIGETGRESIAGDIVPLASFPRPRFAAGLFNPGTGSGLVSVFEQSGVLARTESMITAGNSQGRLSAFANTGGGSRFTLDMNGLQHLYAADATLLGRGERVYGGLPIVVGSTVPGIDLLAASNFGAAGMAIASGSPGATPPLAIPTRWHAGSVSPYGCGGAIVQCADGLRFAVTRLALADLDILNAVDGTPRARLSLVGGRAFPENMIPAGLVPGTLSEVSSTRSLDGVHPAFVVGGSDGFLYAIDACAGTLMWSYDFHAAVGHVIFADTDGDGADEILTETADGFLNALDTLVFRSPGSVLDTDPRHGISVDVDQICGDALFAHWDSVPDATSYEWAVFTVRGDPVSHSPTDPTNPYTRVSAATNDAMFRGDLVIGSRYIFAVRAIGRAGTSHETLSNGVRFVGPCDGPDGGVPDAGPPDGGTLDSGTPPACSTPDCRPDLQLEGRAGPWGCRCAVVGGRRLTRGGGVHFLAILGVLALASTRRRRRSQECW